MCHVKARQKHKLILRPMFGLAPKNLSYFVRKVFAQVFCFLELIKLLTYFMFSILEAGHPLDRGVLRDDFAREIFSDPQFGIFPTELHLGVVKHIQ